MKTNDDDGFDEAEYLRSNPDVARAVKAGKISSGRQHYDKFGKAEGRPIPRSGNPDLRTFAFGAYGTNNVGDEAIFEGVAKEFPGAIQLYINKSRFAEAVWFVDVLESSSFFRRGDHLIIGGGGLLYHIDAIQHMLDLAKKAKAAKAEVSILGIGCEGIQSGYASCVAELFRLASKLTVRSALSQELIRKTLGIESIVQADFAYCLSDEVEATTGAPDGPVQIGVVTGGDIREDYTELSRVIQLATLNSLADEDKVCFTHVPHSRAYVDPYNNDTVVGNALWSSINIYHPGREDCFKLADFTPDPRMVLRAYSQFDGVMSARFHGKIFAQLAGLPILALKGDTIKNRSFIDAYQGRDLFVATSQADLSRAYSKFIDCVRARRQAARRHPQNIPANG